MALFGKSQRLLRRREFDTVTRHGRHATSKHFVVIYRANQQECARLGLIASRRVGNAVARNRVKRRVREWFRAAAEGLKAYDLVVIARRGSPELSTLRVESELSGATARLLDKSRKRDESTGSGGTAPNGESR